MFITLAFVTAFLAVLPTMIGRKFLLAAISGTVFFFLSWGIYYLSTPSLVWPLFGFPSGLVIIWLVIMAVATAIGYGENGNKSFAIPLISNISLAVVLIALYILIGINSWALFKADRYAAIIGEIEKRKWTQDVQPKDPRHVRLVPLELADLLGSIRINENNAIGSQYDVGRFTLQLANNELAYIAPLEFKRFRVWSSEGVSPGYIRVHGEDPQARSEIKTGQSYRYMLSAYWSYNLERHLWKKYYRYGLTDYSFEVDEEGNAFWVVTVFKPTIGWSGKKVLGVVVVDPVSGEDTFYPLGEIPNWIDRAVPKEFVRNYLYWHGEYKDGWWNSFWARKDITEPEEPNIVYGSDGNPYWCTGITSPRNDESLVGYAYTASRTGKTIFYKAEGGTDKAVMKLVNNTILYRQFHGNDPVLYNIDGVMTSIVPFMGENHTFQGVAFVNVGKMVMGYSFESVRDAYHDYLQKIAATGEQISVSGSYYGKKIEGVVVRFGQDTSSGETTYCLCIDKSNLIFTGTTKISPELPITLVGDHVILWFTKTGEDVVPLTAFDNTIITTAPSDEQKQVHQRVIEQQKKEQSQEGIKNWKDKVTNMSDEEFKQFMGEHPTN